MKFKSKNKALKHQNLSKAIYNLFKGRGFKANSNNISDSPGNDEVVIYEGEIYKFNPGFKIDWFQKKFMQITNKSVVLYKDEINAKASKPMITIPLEFISSIQKVDPIISNWK